jgi:serine/threonine-protein phosphatase 2A regulatory subunit B'
VTQLLLLRLLCHLCLQAVLPIVFGALEENAANHWNPAVHGLTCNVRKMFMVSEHG